jgi:mono/diheme cytochrome c family protein
MTRGSDWFRVSCSTQASMACGGWLALLGWGYGGDVMNTQMVVNSVQSALTHVRTVRRGLLAGGVMLVASLAHAAGDPVNGRVLYNDATKSTNGDNCAGCHNVNRTTQPTGNRSKIWNGAHAPSVIQNAIDTNNNGMGEFSYLTPQEVQDIAAYIGPTMLTDVSSRTYASTQVGSTAATQTITLTNYGIQLKLAGIALSGANASDFTITGGSCAVGGLVADTTTCTVQVAFTPAGTGTRSASLTLSGNATNTTGVAQASPTVTPVVITLTGTGAAAPAPIQGISTSTLTFAATVLGSSATPQSVTVSNTGNAPLTLTSIALANTSVNPGDFSLGGTCSTSTPVAAGGGSCTVAVTFTPQASTGTRTASLKIASALTTSTVSLSGVAAAVPVPLVTWGSSSVAFPSTQAGATSAASTVTLQNTGQAALNITSLSASPAVFTVASNTCGSSLAAGASCTASMTFTPAAVQAYTGTLSLVSNAAGSPHTVSLSGTGTALPLPVASLSTSTVAFASTPVSSSSSATGVILSNAGPGNLTLSQLTLVGANPGDFTLTSGTCDVTSGSVVLAPGGSCQASVVFSPVQTGSRAATLQFTHDGAGASTVALSGSAGAATTMGIDKTAVSLTWNATTSTSTTGSVTLNNPGSTVLTVALTNSSSLVAVTGQSACGAGSNATTIVIDPAQSCVLTVSSTGVVSGGTLTFNAGTAGSPVVTVTAAATTPTTPATPVTTTEPTNVGAGGCSLGDPNAPLDPIWPAMTLGAIGVMAWRRVTRQQRSRVDGQMDRP